MASRGGFFAAMVAALFMLAAYYARARFCPPLYRASQP